MENSTKALLIAAAVLVAIIIISISLTILNSSSETTNKASTTTENMKSSAFNSKFTSYFSDSASASHTKSLISKVISNNSAASSSDSFSPDEHQIHLNLYPVSGSDLKHKWKTEDLQNIYKNISSTSRYKIGTTACTVYTNPPGYYNGYLICISITELN